MMRTRSGVNRVTVLAAAAMLLLVAGCNSDHDDNRWQPVDSQPVTEHTLAAPALGNSRLAKIEAAQVLRIGVRADAPPFGFTDKEGRPQGFDVDLGFRIARALNVQPVFVTVTSQNRIEKLKRGEVDVILATLTATRRRSQEIDFSMPYFQDQQSLLVPAASPIQSYRDLAGKKVGCVAGTTSLDNLKVVAPDCHPVIVDSNVEVFEKLSKGEVDAITGDGLTLRALDQNSADPKAFHIAGEGFSVEPYAVGLPQNDSQLRSRIDEILTDIWTSGVWTRVFNRWLGPETPYNLETHFQMPILPR
jgi:polar amino acid transport system substrate-binding protein